MLKESYNPYIPLGFKNPDVKRGCIYYILGKYAIHPKA
jgi:hypothetical protein